MLTNINTVRLIPEDHECECCCGCDCGNDCVHEECECKICAENNNWRYSNYQNKDIEYWDVDDHLASCVDDIMEK